MGERFPAFLILGFAAVSALLLSHLVQVKSRPARWLVRFVLYDTLLLVPVQFVGALQIVGWVHRFRLAPVAMLEALLLIAVTILARRFHSGASPIADENAHSERLPLYVRLAAIALAACSLVFFTDLFTSYPWGWDALEYHLPLSLRWLLSGTMAIPPSHNFLASMPGNAEVLAMLTLATGFQSLASIFNLFAYAALGAAVYLVALEFSHDRIASVMAAIAAMTIPQLQFQAFSEYVDLQGTACILAAAALFLHRRSSRVTLVAALAAGIAVGTKAVFYPYAAAFFVIAAATLLKERAGWKPLTCLTAGCASPCIFWFWRNALETGNPVYPMRVSVGGHVFFSGMTPSEITPAMIYDRSAHTLGQLLAYPWTERNIVHGVPGAPYGVDAGLGAAFATLVPLGLLYCAWHLRSRQGKRTLVVYACVFTALTLLWYVSMEHYVRYGLPLWASAFALSAPLFAKLRRRNPRVLGAAFLAAVAVTSGISAFTPLHKLLTRVRGHEWTRASNYEYPPMIDNLPAGSVLVNRATKFNFELAGRRLSNRVIPEFELPPDLDARALQQWKADYIVESTEYEPQLTDFTPDGATLIYDKSLKAGDNGKSVHWRIWKVVAPEYHAGHPGT